MRERGERKKEYRRKENDVEIGVSRFFAHFRVLFPPIIMLCEFLNGFRIFLQPDTNNKFCCWSFMFQFMQ
jgi:hypothetical protein